MLELHFNNILFIIIFFNLLFIAAIAFFNKNGKPYANRIFALFLLTKVFAFSFSFFIENFNYAINRFINIFYLGLSFDLLLGPLMLLYIRALTYKRLKLSLSKLWHLLPFLSHLVYMTIIFYSKNSTEKLRLIESRELFSKTFIIVNDIVIYLVFIVYFIFIVDVIKNYHSNVKSTYANFNRHQMKWMLFLFAGLVAIWSIGIVNNTLGMLGIYLNLPLAAFIIPIFIFTNVIFFYGMNYSTGFGGITENDQNLKYKKTNIDENRKSEILSRLLNYTETQKPYLEPDININKLADELKVPSYQLSQILNSKLNKNFFEFISYYRIKESMAELAKPDNNEKTILEILYEVGFNSKSAFNNAFKKHTGVTPTQFKKKPQSVEIQPIFN